MSAHNWVLRDNRLTTSNTSSGNAVVNLLDTGVNSPQAVKPLAELGRQTLIGQSHVGEDSITTAGWAIQQVEEGSARRLLLEGHIRVPGYRVGAALQEFRTALVVGSAVNKVDLRESLGGTGGLVNVVTPEVAAKLDGLLDRQACKVLVTEGCAE